MERYEDEDRTLNISAIISTLCDISKRSRRELSLTMGFSENFLSTIIYQKQKPGVANVARLAKEVGYKLILVPSDFSVPQDGYEIIPDNQ